MPITALQKKNNEAAIAALEKEKEILEKYRAMVKTLDTGFAFDQAISICRNQMKVIRNEENAKL